MFCILYLVTFWKVNCILIELWFQHIICNSKTLKIKRHFEILDIHHYSITRSLWAELGKILTLKSFKNTVIQIVFLTLKWAITRLIGLFMFTEKETASGICEPMHFVHCIWQTYVLEKRFVFQLILTKVFCILHFGAHLQSNSITFMWCNL